MTKVAVVMSSVSRNAGGLFEVCREVYSMLNMNTEVFSLEDQYTNQDIKEWNNVSFNLGTVKGFKSFGYSSALNRHFDNYQDEIGVLHLHGIWMYTHYLAYKFGSKNNVKTIISPHGMLDPWAINNSKYKKKIIGLLFANKSLQKADCIHALNLAEYEAIRAYGLKNPVAIIPNGITLPTKQNTINKSPLARKKLLFLGRIHPKKGIQFLIEAINQLKIRKKEDCFLTEWELIISGWSQNGYEQILKDMVHKYQIKDIVKFIGPSFDTDKCNLYQNVDAFILPSQSEGLPMTVLEAWAYKLPTLITDKCNLPEGFDYKASIRILNNVNYLSQSLSLLASLNEDELASMGKRAYSLVKDKFTWNRVVNMYEDSYKWMLGEIEKPEFVRLD